MCKRPYLEFSCKDKHIWNVVDGVPTHPEYDMGTNEEFLEYCDRAVSLGRARRLPIACKSMDTEPRWYKLKFPCADCPGGRKVTNEMYKKVKDKTGVYDKEKKGVVIEVEESDVV